MDYRHGIETAKEIVNEIWSKAIEGMEVCSSRADEIRGKFMKAEYGTPERSEADCAWNENHAEWRSLLGKADACQEIYEALNREIAKSREAV